MVTTLAFGGLMLAGGFGDGQSIRSDAPALLSGSQGDDQAQPGGSSFVGWGELPYFTEFNAAGQAVLDGHLPAPAQVYRALLENAAGFYGAQMTAMDNATRNAGDMIKSYTIQYNRTRQAQITKELIEIISGAEAL